MKPEQIYRSLKESQCLNKLLLAAE